MLKHTEDQAAAGKRGGAAEPFVYSRTITWGDTDPGEIVFTGRYLEYAVDAVEAWFTATFGVNWYELKHDLGLGSPFRFANLDFKAPLTPRDRLEVEVRVPHVGTTSVRFDLRGYGVSAKAGRRHCFSIDAMIVFVDENLKKTPIPADFRARLAKAGWIAE